MQITDMILPNLDIYDMVLHRLTRLVWFWVFFVKNTVIV